MKNNKLSIIIPCYNSVKTLEEALASVYKQKLALPFEVILIDDKSKDNTRALIRRLAKKYKNVRYFFNQKNLGGGATRNLGIKKASGDLFFCLDSDDVLSVGMLRKMVDCWLAKKCDGVGISKSVKFKGRNKKDVDYVNNFGYVGKLIPFEALFETKIDCPLFSTFLFTRQAFKITGGYPTNHGFDTQGFAFRFLANGLKAYTCPNTTYFHRVGFGRSYYIREYEAGRALHNWFKIYAEFLFLFNDKLKEAILDYDLNGDSEYLSDFVNRQADRFRKNYRVLIKPGIKDDYKKAILSGVQKSKYDFFWLGNEEYERRNYPKAAKYLLKAISGGLKSDKVYFKIFDALARINNMSLREVENRIKKLNRLQLKGRRRPALEKIKARIRYWRKRLIGKNS